MIRKLTRKKTYPFCFCLILLYGKPKSRNPNIIVRKPCGRVQISGETRKTEVDIMIVPKQNKTTNSIHR